MADPLFFFLYKIVSSPRFRMHQAVFKTEQLLVAGECFLIAGV